MWRKSWFYLRSDKVPPNIVSCAREHFMICCSPSTVASQFNSNMPRFKINQTGQKFVMKQWQIYQLPDTVGFQWEKSSLLNRTPSLFSRDLFSKKQDEMNICRPSHMPALQNQKSQNGTHSALELKLSKGKGCMGQL